MLAVGLLNTILLIRAMSLFELKLKIKTSILIVIVLSGMIICVVYSNLNWYLGFFRAGVISLVLASGIFSIFQCSTKKYKSIFLGISIFIAFMGGMFVNPVEVSGLESVYSTDIVQSIKKINDEEPGIWIVEGSYPYNNLPIIVGASTINSTNIYPDIVRWQNISDNPEDFEIYNRYAHIAIQLKIENKTSFELIQPDVFKVNLNVDDLRKMGVNYILTTDNLEKYNGNDIEFKEYYNSEKFNIYKIENKE